MKHVAQLSLLKTIIKFGQSRNSSQRGLRVSRRAFHKSAS